MKENILIIDDDIVTCNLIHGYLTANNYNVLIGNCGAMALTYINEVPMIDLILLDLELPDINGNELIKKIREHSNIPIIMISVRDLEIDTVISLTTGSDDYIIKPIRPFELIARIQAVLRRYKQSESFLPQIIKAGPLSLDQQTQKVFLKDHEVFLTKLEYSLLYHLSLNKGLVLTKDKLFQLVWGDRFYDDNTLTVAIARLRLKLEANPRQPRLIHTIRNSGYLLEWK